MKRAIALIAAVGCVALSVASAGSAHTTARATNVKAHAVTTYCLWTNLRASPVLWIRSGPGTGYKTVGSIPIGQSFLGECGDYAWIYIEAGALHGWVNAAYLY
jgi:uncharacterized protein YgiM (DUF1202 family)